MTTTTQPIRQVGAVELDTVLRAASASELDVLIWFTAQWCGPCEKLRPVLETVAERHSGRLSVIAVDIDDWPEVYYRYQVGGIPGLALMHRGQRVWQESFPRGLDELDELLSRLMDVVAETDPSGADSPAPPMRPARTFEVPAELPANVRVSPYQPTESRGADATPVAPGSTLDLPAGQVVQVALEIDHRQHPPVAVGALRRFEPGSIDTLRLHVTDDLRPEDLLVPALSELSAVYLTGSRSPDSEVLRALAQHPNLRQVVCSSGELAEFDRDTTAINGHWVAAELRAALPADDQEAAAEPADAGLDTLDLASYRETTIICFAAGGRRRQSSPHHAIVDFARSRGVPVVVADFDRTRTFQSTWGIGHPWSCLVVREGRIVWLCTMFAPNTMMDKLSSALAFAATLDLASATELTPFAASPGRMILLPDEPIWHRLTLVSPDQPADESTKIAWGGIVQSPPGWRIRVEAPEHRIWPWLADELGPRGVDIVEVFDEEPMPVEGIAVLARLTGLQQLRLLCPMSEELIATITALPHLRCLDCGADGEDLAALRRALPRAIVNDEWIATTGSTTW